MSDNNDIRTLSGFVGKLISLQNPTHGVSVGFVGFPYREPYNPTPQIFRQQTQKVER
jgi:hypothetical protein